MTRFTSIQEENFTNAYIQCALETDGRGTDDTGATLDTFVYSELHPSAIETLEANAAKFYRAMSNLMTGNESIAGHHFWLSHNKHGVSFLCQDCYGEFNGAAMYGAAKMFDALSFYRGKDGKVYLESA